MVTRTFQGDYGAAVAPADSSSALAAWLVEAAANDGSTLTIEPGSYHWASTNGPTHGLINATINGYGASVDVMFIGNAGLLQENYTQSARIATVLAGATSVTVIDPSGIDSLPGAHDVTLFSVNDWIMVAGLSLQNFGYPPNFQWNEFRKITGIVGSVISFVEPLANTYRSTWPILDSGHASSVDLGGPATIYRMLPQFDGVQTYSGLRCTNTILNGGDTFVGGGKSLLIQDMYFDGDGPGSSVGKSITIRNTQIGKQNEVDKCVEYMEYNNCTGIVGAQIECQSALGGRLVIRNCNLTSLNGTPRICEIYGSTFSEVVRSPFGFGITESLRAVNSTIIFSRQGGVDAALIPADFTAFSGGTFTVPNASATEVWAGAVPGGRYVFAYYDGSIHDTPDSGPQVTFIITAVRQDATNTYVDTTIVGALPTPVFGGNAANVYLAEATMSIESTGGPAKPGKGKGHVHVKGNWQFN